MIPSIYLSSIISVLTKFVLIDLLHWYGINYDWIRPDNSNGSFGARDVRKTYCWSEVGHVNEVILKKAKSIEFYGLIIEPNKSNRLFDFRTRCWFKRSLNPGFCLVNIYQE